MTKGRISSIQRASIHDGPGIRTTVFFKGCPLSCRWCHNPECIHYEIEEMYYPEKCIGCGMCDKGCYSGARIQSGRDVTTDELMHELVCDRAYYQTGGGVTLSGGEPLMQKAFLKELIHKIKRERIHIALESSMYLYDEEIFQSIDYLMCDIKIFDREIHREYTGVYNDIIFENIKKYDKLCKPLVVRTPVILNIDQGFEHILNFVCSLNNVVKYELLPYHPLGIEKSRALGVQQTAFSIPTQEQINQLRKKYAYVHR